MFFSIKIDITQARHFRFSTVYSRCLPIFSLTILHLVKIKCIFANRKNNSIESESAWKKRTPNSF